MDKTDDFLNRASMKGLRTLLMAMKIVDEDEYKQFMAEIAEADKDVMTRDKNHAKIYDKFERDLVLVGATAVEDRLQDNVPETIHDLQNAGIKIWMLTGDKLETAENIGFSCRLLKNEMKVFRIASEAEAKEVCSEKTVQENEKLRKEFKERGLLVEANSLRIVLANPEYRKNFLKIAKSCEAVICCRVSPSQKADVVRLIKGDDD